MTDILFGISTRVYNLRVILKIFIIEVLISGTKCGLGNIRLGQTQIVTLQRIKGES